jgi:hypothetical protein
MMAMTTGVYTTLKGTCSAVEGIRLLILNLQAMGKDKAKPDAKQSRRPIKSSANKLQRFTNVSTRCEDGESHILAPIT